MELLVRAILLGMAERDPLRDNARRIHQTESRDKPASPLLAKGLPLSLRMRCGNPDAANARSKL
jgi:hypothetical protein